MSRPTTIALVAGEASGDQLGGKLIEALRRYYPEARFCGVGGDHMRRAGFETWWDREELSVMGLSEIIRHLPRLIKLRRALRERLLDERPDVLIGIDAPDFNLGLEVQVKQAGMLTIHYVSPTVWAWRSWRTKKIARATDMVLCLFPFEPAFYKAHGVRARYTGHPMADVIQDDPDRVLARKSLGIDVDGPLLALLPGSRGSEVSRLAPALLEAASLLAREQPAARFVAALADERTATMFRTAAEAYPDLDYDIVTGRSLDVMAAADVVVCASGTASLECMLVNRPMVVVYTVSPTTYWMFTTFKLLKSRFIALPNILGGEALIPELKQDEANGAAIAREVIAWLDDPGRLEALKSRFTALHDELRCDAAASAAKAVRDLLGTGNG